jgi:endoglucanase
MRILSILLAMTLSFSCGGELKDRTFPKIPDPTTKPEQRQPEQKVPEQKKPTQNAVTSWQTDHGKVFRNGEAIQLRGINWFGFETNDLVVHGLWTGRSVESYLRQIKDLGFNALRLPLSPKVFVDGNKSTQGHEKPLDNLHELLDTAQDFGIVVLLDLHTCSSKKGLVGSPLACDGYTAQSWFATLEKMAALSLKYPNILGVDLFNEPYKLTWKEWKELSGEASKHVLGVNANILIVIEGVSGNGANWGGNLVDAASDLPNVKASQLMFSPHTYGPSVADQPYFHTADFPNNMPKIWDTHFGYLTAKGFALSPGEFGGRYSGQDKVWQDAFIEYLVKKDMRNFFYWSLNPNSGDTGGILQDDWTTVNKDKMELLKKLF